MQTDPSPPNPSSPSSKTKSFTHYQKRTFSFDQKDECWNKVCYFKCIFLVFAFLKILKRL